MSPCITCILCALATKMSSNADFFEISPVPAALLVLFQSLSCDGQYNVMNSVLQSEPNHGWLGLLYFVSFAILIGNVIINVFVAVLTNVLAHFRVIFDDAVKKRFASSDEQLAQKGRRPFTVKVDPPVGSTNNPAVLNDTGMDENNEKNEYDETAGQDGADGEEKGKTGEQDGESKPLQYEIEAEMDETEVEREEILVENLSQMTVAASRVFRSDRFNGFVMLVIFSNCTSLALIGRYEFA